MFLVSEFAAAENFMEFEGVEGGSVLAWRFRVHGSDGRKISSVFVELVEHYLGDGKRQFFH